MKTMLEMVEKTIQVALLTSSCLGFTVIGWFFMKLFLLDVTEKYLWWGFVTSLVLTWVLNQLLTVVGQKLIHLDLEELAFMQDEEAQDLYKHLEVK